MERCAVLGAGLMGSGIAAHLANAGLPVLLLDMPAKEGARSAAAASAIERMLKSDPQMLMLPENARLITPGNFDDDLGQLAGCDWIIEVVVEDLCAKRALYDRIDAIRKPGSIVSSNTSTIPLRALAGKQSPEFRRDFCITHFFNPPRYMRLLELVTGPETRPEVGFELTALCDLRLGKGVVRCKDTPGFIANRIGTHWITCAVNEAIARGITVEEADAVHVPMGIPKTGVFGLLDLVGLDLIPLITLSMLRGLPPDDDFRRVAREQPLITRMIAEGKTGRKSNGGFYRRVKSGQERMREAIDLGTGAYRPATKPRLEALEAGTRDLGALVRHRSPAGEYARAVLVQVLTYAASLVPAIADDIPAVDRAMRLGYAWGQGPFEMIDRLGADWLAEAAAAEGLPVPPLLTLARGRSFYRVHDGALEYLTTAGDYAPVTRPEGVLLLEDVRRAGKPLLSNGSAKLWDIGDRVLCFEFTSKMNALDPDTMTLLGQALDVAAGSYRGMVIYNEGENFSVGANLGIAMFAANVAAWPVIEQQVAGGQAAYKALKYAPVPVVGAPAGMALGGGCEILLHCSAVQAHAETYMGLVEVGVGLVPGWGGCKELLARWQAEPILPRGPLPAVAKAFETISTAQVSKSAAQARGLHYLRITDGITMNRDRLLNDAKQRVLALAEDYRPPSPTEFRLPGPGGRVALELAVDGFAASGRATPHDVVVSKTLARVLSGGDTDPLDTLGEDAISTLEREAFMTLVRHPASLARAEHMLATGKPLRN
ncbi:MAG: 3-hydroxyacyl-CoA dehydrogenase/enoyl-CoA hydratase family protein [Pseudomonadota bacterium]|nr:3-hydroxyacyl-CoA dehydrogenase/enoyl-CoA hydratase family protein [Pseudomonadota bacterium]